MICVSLLTCSTLTMGTEWCGTLVLDILMGDSDWGGGGEREFI